MTADRAVTTARSPTMALIGPRRRSVATTPRTRMGHLAVRHVCSPPQGSSCVPIEPEAVSTHLQGTSTTRRTCTEAHVVEREMYPTTCRVPVLHGRASPVFGSRSTSARRDWGPMTNTAARRGTHNGDSVIASLAGPLAWGTADRSSTLVEAEVGISRRADGEMPPQGPHIVHPERAAHQASGRRSLRAVRQCP